METRFPDGINNVSEPHFLVSFSEQEPFWFKGLLSVPSGYLFPSTASLLIFTKMRGTAAFYSSSPLCHTVIGLRVAGSVFTVGQLHPAGCAVGVPSVVWELCLQDTTLPGENGLGGGIGRVGAAWLLSGCYAFDLIQILSEFEDYLYLPRLQKTQWFLWWLPTSSLSLRLIFISSTSVNKPSLLEIAVETRQRRWRAKPH